MDTSLAPRCRAELLVAELDLDEKVGLMFHPIIDVGADGELVEDELVMSACSTTEYLVERRITHFNVHGLSTPELTATWVNKLQKLAAETGHGIPVTISSDPRHGFNENSGVSFAAQFMSQWPETMGFSALDDPELVRTFADMARAEYVAVGIRAALHPQIDLVTEPRWGRQAQCIGQNPERVSRMVEAYLAGFQGDRLGPDSVACMTKHFPGGGPQENGDDPHFPYGANQVYPGGRFEDHLAPFRAAVAAGTSALMPYYGRPVGLTYKGQEIESVGFGYNKQVITGILREELGHDGVVCTDWGLVTGPDVMGKPFPAKAWGVEHLSEPERVAMIIEAGCDQFGGEFCTEVLMQLVRDGVVAESRLDQSAVRLLTVKFELGLFDNPYVDLDGLSQRVGRPEAIELGRRTQSRSVTVLKKTDDVLPLRPCRVHLVGFTSEAVPEGFERVDDPASADVAIVRTCAGFEPRDEYFLESWFHQRSLDFDEEQVRQLHSLAEQLPVVLAVNLDRAAILTPVDEQMTAIVGEFGCSDEALFDALTGRVAPEGRLPFELPRSMAAVEASRPDVANDTADPLYPMGHGLTI